jgi:hypothetical protein
MNSESGKARAGNNLFSAPFKVLKILGAGVFGKMDFSRSALQLLKSAYGGFFVEKWRLPSGNQADHSFAMRLSCDASRESFTSSSPCFTN